jgi:hypothetical protein
VNQAGDSMEGPEMAKAVRSAGQSAVTTRSTAAVSVELLEQATPAVIEQLFQRSQRACLARRIAGDLCDISLWLGQQRPDAEGFDSLFRMACERLNNLALGVHVLMADGNETVSRVFNDAYPLESFSVEALQR